MLNTAVDDELVRRNPCRIKGAGAEKSGERPVATPEQVLALAAAMPERWRALVLLAATTSLRWGELMALTRADVDLERRTVRVVKAVSELNGKVVTGPPKTAAGRRTVAVPTSVLAVLRSHVASFWESGAHGRVFVGVRGRTLRRTNFQRLWLRGIEAAGLPAGFRFHDLRHTGNTWAAATGANLRELMERMGHSSTRAALIYLHAAKEGDRSIAAGIDRHLIGSNVDGGEAEGVDRE